MQNLVIVDWEANKILERCTKQWADNKNYSDNSNLTMEMENLLNHSARFNSLAHGSECSRRWHGLWPKKATFLALIISDEIFKTSILTFTQILYYDINNKIIFI